MNIKIKIIFLAFLLSFNISKSFAKDLEIRLLGGANFNSKITSIRGDEFDNNSVNTGLASATLRKKIPGGYNIGLDASYFANDFIGLNGGISHTEFRSRSQNVYISDGSGASWSHNFPGFSLKGFLINAGPVFRAKNISGLNDSSSIFKNFTPYVGINLAAFYGSMSNVNYDPKDITLNSAGSETTYTFGSSYGAGGHSRFNAYGYMPRIGLNYKFANNMTLSLEYRKSIMRAYGDRMRSYQDGFKAKIYFDSLLLGLGYQF